MSATPRAFEAFGLELEYMIVERDTLDVHPIADRLLEHGELERGDQERCVQERRAALAWSNELVAHVIELKNPRPTADLGALARGLRAEVQAMNQALQPLGGRLMPGAMHPWMDPRRETRLWPHGAIYRAYDRIFDCRTHGWANLQSLQINLPFADDREFARLHRAIRLALPILPAIAASSPFQEGRAPGPLDCRMEAYGTNSDAVPAMTGQLVPEPVASRAQYEREILRPLYEALIQPDPEGVLREEWANARGAIARFDRNAIEIRVVDLQECPSADTAVAAAIIDLVALLYGDDPQDDVPTEELARVLQACIRDAERAFIGSRRFLSALGVLTQACCAGELWQRLEARMREAPHRALWQPMLGFILSRGPLARRLLQAAGPAPSHAALKRLYAYLCECLSNDRRFDPSICS